MIETVYDGIESFTARPTAGSRSCKPCCLPRWSTNQGSLVRHEPPTPILGVRMFTCRRPLGRLFAAAITSSTSTPTWSHSFASSLPNAMFRSIHRLLASLTISAVRVSLTLSVSTPSPSRQKNSARSLLASSTPLTMTGTDVRSAIADPSASRSGQNAR